MVNSSPDLLELGLNRLCIVGGKFANPGVQLIQRAVGFNCKSSFPMRTSKQTGASIVSCVCKCACCKLRRQALRFSVYLGLMDLDKAPSSEAKQRRYDEAYMRMAQEAKLFIAKESRWALIVKDQMIIADGYNGTSVIPKRAKRATARRIGMSCTPRPTPSPNSPRATTVRREPPVHHPLAVQGMCQADPPGRLCVVFRDAYKDPSGLPF